MTSKITIYEMAEKAKVSIATISRALNPETRKKVSPETLTAIDALAKKYHYTPSLAAKHLSKSSYQTIGVLIPHHPGILSQDYYCQILSGVADALIDRSYQLKIIMLKCGEQKWDQHDFKASEGIDGMIVTHWHAFFSQASVFKKLRIPSLVISDTEENVKTFFVSGDHRQGGRLAAEHLYSNGHRKIGVVTGPKNSSDSSQRLTGFKDYLLKKNISIPEKRVLCGEFQEGIAESLTGDFIKKNQDMTAIFCLNDSMALGVIRALRRLGISCPGQISIVGYDNDRRCEQTTPALTSIQSPTYDLVKEGCRRLTEYLQLSKKGGPFTGSKVLPVELIERKSVRQIG